MSKRLDNMHKNLEQRFRTEATIDQNLLALVILTLIEEIQKLEKRIAELEPRELHD